MTQPDYLRSVTLAGSSAGRAWARSTGSKWAAGAAWAGGGQSPFWATPVRHLCTSACHASFPGLQRGHWQSESA